MTYKEFVRRRITPSDPEEREPFCPFSTPNCMGYCNVAYSESCYSCEESLGEYVLNYIDNGKELYPRIEDTFESGHTLMWYVEKTEEFLKEIGESSSEGTDE